MAAEFGASAGQATRSVAFPFALLQEQPDAMQVGGQYRQRYRAREAVGAMSADSVKAPDAPSR